MPNRSLHLIQLALPALLFSACSGDVSESRRPYGNGDSTGTAGDSTGTAGDSTGTAGDGTGTAGDSSGTAGDSSGTAGDGTPPASSLAWPPPTLDNPVTINLSDSNHSLKLDASTDYLLVMPQTVLDVGDSNLSINGGHNVVLIGGELTGNGANGSIRATNQSGTLHIEGLYISGGSDLKEGIQLQNQDNATVQLENIRFDMVHGSQDGHHADLVQTWGGGPKTLRIDGLSGSTNYQAFMLQDGHDADIADWDFRRVNIHHIGTAGWTMFDGNPHVDDDDGNDVIRFTDIYLEGNDNNGVYSLGHGGLKSGLHWGNPPDGDFVPDGLAGLDYGSSHR